jgi:hypothetical protein
MTKMAGALGAGLALQVGMVVFGHYVPQAQQVGLFPIAGTLIGGITGWLAAYAGAVTPATARGASIACVCGIVGSLVSSRLGDVPVSNFLLAGGATLVAGAIGGIIRSRVGREPRLD